MSAEELARIAEEMRSNNNRKRQRNGDGWPSLLPPPSDPMAVARLLVEMHFLLDEVLIVRCWGGSWWTWRTTHWSEVPERIVRSLLYHYTENAIYLDAKGFPAPWAPTRKRIGDLLEALAAIAILPQDFAQPCWLDGRRSGQIVAVGNGLLDIDSRLFYPHTPLYFSTVSVPFDYDPAAPEPRHFLDFLNELWPQETEPAEALAEWWGYVISGRTNLQKMSFTIGPTRGGKGLMARVLTALIGKRNVCGPTLSSFAGEFGLAPLLGKSLAIISDVRFSGKGANIVVERLLSISGEDTLTINRKYHEQIDARMPTRMNLISSEMPRLTDASGAIIGRFIVLILTRSWLGKEDHELEARGACLDHQDRALHSDVAGAVQGHLALSAAWLGNPKSCTPMRPAYRRRSRPANWIAAGCRRAVIVATSKRSQRVCSMGGPVMEWIFAPILQPIIILATILTQRFNASFAPIAIDPSSSEHATSNINNTIQNVGLWYGNRLNTKRCQRLETGPATAELPYSDVMGEVMVAILESVLDALVVQYLSVVIETDT